MCFIDKENNYRFYIKEKHKIRQNTQVVKIKLKK